MIEHATFEQCEASEYRALQIGHAVVSLVPVAWLAVFAVLALGATVYHGGTPQFGTPDPQRMGLLSLLHLPSLVLFYLSVMALPSALTVTFVMLVAKVPMLIRGGWAWAYGVALVVYLWLVTMDPAGVVTWMFS